MKKGRILFKGEYKGHKMVVVANTSVGIRCGYVQIPEEVKDNIENVLDAIPFHGGVTYGPKEDYWGDGGTWIGFDCGHYTDGFDPRIMSKELKSFWKDRKYLLAYNGMTTIKTTAFVKKNLKEGIDWLVNFERMLKVKGKLALKKNG